MCVMSQSPNTSPYSISILKQLSPQNCLKILSLIFLLIKKTTTTFLPSQNKVMNQATLSGQITTETRIKQLSQLSLFWDNT